LGVRVVSEALCPISTAGTAVGSGAYGSPLKGSAPRQAAGTAVGSGAYAMSLRRSAPS
jgi:hypothetical protein